MKTKKQYLTRILLLSASLLFYLFFAFYDKVVICHDSPNYIDMNYSREPFYSMYLAFFRWISPGNNQNYLFFAILFQSILAALAAFLLVDYLYRELNLSSVTAWLLLFMPFATSLLCRFAAKRGSMYSNSIMTEGLAISFYLLLIRFVFEYYLHHSKSSFIICCILCFLGISTRKQMLVLLAIFMMAILFCSASSKFLHRFILSVVTGVLILGCVSLFDTGYNYILRGEATGHVNDNRFIATMTFYTADRSDYSYIDDKGLQELFLSIYDACDENEYLYHQAEGGWFNEVDQFSDSYDMIQLYQMVPQVENYVKNDGRFGSYEEQQLEVDRIHTVFIKSVLPHHLTRLTHVWFNNLLAGLVTSVAQRTHLLSYYSLFIYGLYLVLFGLLLKHNKRVKSLKIKGILIFSGTTFISILLNVSVVSSVIFCQTRYTIYNMPLFYISLIMMIMQTMQEIRLTPSTQKNSQNSATQKHRFA